MERNNVSGQAKPATWGQLRTGHIEKDMVCRLESPEKGDLRWRTNSVWLEDVIS